MPEHYSQAYNYYTGRGYRVLALASKFIDQEEEHLSKDEERKVLEGDLNFVGLFVCNSPLKEDTLKCIENLQRAAYKLIMITGDNLFTAATVGQQLKFGRDILVVERQGDRIIVEVDKTNHVEVKTVAEFRNLIGKSALVCTSSTSKLPPEFLPHIAIFARTSPSEKEYIVKKLKELEGK